MGVVSLSALGGPYVFAEVSRGRGQCPLSGVGKCPPLVGFLSTSSMGKSIGGTKLVRCREVVRFSEGPLLEVLLYYTYGTFYS